MTFFCQKTTLYLLETNNFKWTAADSIAKTDFSSVHSLTARHCNANNILSKIYLKY